MPVCPFCGGWIPDGEYKCWKCNKSLLTTVCESCGTKQYKYNKFCQKCGKRL